MIAALTMYEIDETGEAHNRIWRSISGHLREQGFTNIPSELTRGRADSENWSSPELFLAQTCGYPLMTQYADRLHLVATPVYEALGCEGPNYRSWIVVRNHAPYRSLSDLKGSRAAINGSDSQSGFNALRHSIAPYAEQGNFFSNIKISGGHRASLAMVAKGEADVAAIDCVTYATIQRYHKDEVDRLRILGQSQSVPGLPYVTSRQEWVEPLRSALEVMIKDPAIDDARKAIFLKDIKYLKFEDYQPILAMRDAAAAVLLTGDAGI